MLAPVERHLHLGDQVPVGPGARSQVPVADDLEHRAPHPPEIRRIEAAAQRRAKISGAGAIARGEWQIGAGLDLYEGLRGQQHVIRCEETGSGLPGTQTFTRVSGGKHEFRLHAENRSRVEEHDVFDSDCDVAETCARRAIVLTQPTERNRDFQLISFAKNALVVHLVHRRRRSLCRNRRGQDCLALRKGFLSDQRTRNVQLASRPVRF